MEVTTLLLFAISLGKVTLADLFEAFLKSAEKGVDKDCKPVKGSAVTGFINITSEISVLWSNLERGALGDAAYAEEMFKLVLPRLKEAASVGVKLTLFSEGADKAVTMHELGKYIQVIKGDHILTCFVQGARHIYPSFECIVNKDGTKSYQFGMTQDGDEYPKVEALKSEVVRTFTEQGATLVKGLNVIGASHLLTYPYKSDGKEKVANDTMNAAIAAYRKKVSS